MIFSTFVRSSSDNEILFKNDIPLEYVKLLKYYSDDSIGTFTKKELRWSFNNVYWSAWCNLNQGNLSSIQVKGNRYLFFEIRYTRSNSTPTVTTFNVNYIQTSLAERTVDASVVTIITPTPIPTDYRGVDATTISSTLGNATTLNGQGGDYYTWRPNHRGQQPISSITGLNDFLVMLNNARLSYPYNISDDGIGVLDRIDGSQWLYKTIIGGNNIVVSSNVNEGITIDVSIGTGLQNKLTFWNSENSLSYDNELTYDGYSLILGGEEVSDLDYPAKLEINSTNPDVTDVVIITADVDDYIQIGIRNDSSGTGASTDIVAEADNTSDTTNYVDLGINNSGYNTGFVGDANDAYLYNAGKNLLIGNIEAAQDIIFFSGGADAYAKERLRIQYDGKLFVNKPDSTTYPLEVNGDVNLSAGSAYRINGVPISVVDVTKAYVDGSLSARDTSISWLNTNTIKTKSIGLVIDGGGTSITTGSKGYREIDDNYTIDSWTLLSDVAGSIVIDVKNSNYTSWPTTVSISGSEKPTLTGVAKNQDTNLTTWIKNVSTGDILEFNVESASTTTKVWLFLTLTPR